MYGYLTTATAQQNISAASIVYESQNLDMACILKKIQPSCLMHRSLINSLPKFWYDEKIWQPDANPPQTPQQIW